jgi:dihydroneopterin aldolase/2-amino-4-hydroxy-6-hydroxymethyldihydropteridine diphosphokinase
MNENRPLRAVHDRIEIRGIVVPTVVGVLDHERTSAQPIRVDLDLHVDTHEAGVSDDLADTADYGDVVERVAEVVREAKDVLLERLAGRIADHVLEIRRAEAVDVTVTKLRPPIPEVVDTTGVRITRRRTEPVATGSHEAIVALGSNLGDRESYLRLAVRSLPGVRSMSQVFETDPIGGHGGQGAFLNMVVVLDTDLDPYALLRRCRRIEAEAYRQRVVHWGPRTLDVDLLFYGDVRIDDPALTLPHPRYAERRFVLAPLTEVAPERCPADWDERLPPDGVYPRGPLDLGDDRA